MASGSVWWGVILIEGLHLLVLFSFFFYPLMLRKVERKKLSDLLPAGRALCLEGKSGDEHPPVRL